MFRYRYPLPPRLLVLWLALLLALTPVVPALAQDGGDITLVPYADEAFGIQGLIPDGWTQAGPGVYARASGAEDIVTLIQQAAPGISAAQLGTALAGQIGVSALPDPAGALETDAFAWTLYEVEIEAVAAGLTITVDIALAEADATAYVVVLQMLAADYDTLHEAVFLPVVEALALLDDTASTDFADPDGLYTVPVPTNWITEQADGYALLSDPDDDLTVRIAVVPTADVDEALEAAWAIIDPGFTPAEGDIDRQDIPNEDLDRLALITYPIEEGHITQVEVRVLGDTSYVLIFDGSLEGFQRRSAQVQTIDTGFTIAAIEQVDLSLVEPLPLDEDLIAVWETYIADAMTRFGTPGAAVAIVQDGAIVYRNGFGVRELGGEEAVTPQTQFMIGSTTKTLTTLFMALLVDEGLFSWDTPVIEVWPEFAVSDPDLTQTITMENLVCACTGVPRRDFELILNAESLTAELIMESLGTFEFFTDFGETFQYSNQMVATGGYVAALAAGGEYGTLGEDYAELFQARVLDPLGMTATTFAFDAVTARGDFAMPHSYLLDRTEVMLPLDVERVWLEPVAPAGALWSTVEDMGRYMAMLMAEGLLPDGERLVSAENLGHLWEPQVAINAEADYGLGWIIGDTDGLVTLSHGGNTLGHSSEFAFLPQAGIGVIVMSNEQGSLFNSAVSARLFELLYGQEPQLDAQLDYVLAQLEQQTQDVLADLLPEIDAAVVEAMLGTWTNDALGEVTFSLNADGALVFDAGSFASTLRQADSDDGDVVLITFDPPLGGVGLRLEEDDAGQPVIVLGSGVVEYTFTPVE